jgi:hypothetical protein
MALPPPRTRHFIPCHAVVTDSKRNAYSLEGIIYIIRPADHESFPLLMPEMSLFSVLSNAHGAYEFSVQIITWDPAGKEIEVWQTSKVTRAFGKDPLMVLGWPIRLRNIVFDRPGLYEFRLICDGAILAQTEVSLRERS